MLRLLRSAPAFTPPTPPSVGEASCLRWACCPPKQKQTKPKLPPLFAFVRGAPCVALVGLGLGLFFYAVGKVRYFAVAIDFFNQAVDVGFKARAFFGEVAREFEVVHDFFVEDFAWDE